jgi:hypothetical protein
MSVVQRIKASSPATKAAAVAVAAVGGAIVLAKLLSVGSRLFSTAPCADGEEQRRTKPRAVTRHIHSGQFGPKTPPPGLVLRRVVGSLDIDGNGTDHPGLLCTYTHTYACMNVCMHV